MFNKLLLKALLLPGVLLLVLFVMTFSVAPTLAYWANSVLGSNSTAIGTISNGQWQFTNSFVQGAYTLTNDANQQQAAGNLNIARMYQPTTPNAVAAVMLQSLPMEGVTWEVRGTASGTTLNLPRLGYANVIDRSVNGSGVSYFPILPPAPTGTDPYPFYNFFLADDVENTLTNNVYGFRLNYGVEIISNSTYASATSVSFHAMHGLNAPNETKSMAVNRQFTLFASENRSTWTQIGNGQPGNTTAASAAFTVYNISIPVGLQNKNLYFRLVWNGGTAGNNQNQARYSRMVIDNFDIVTT
jgi:hypothetical protein